jgi:hypothetical protein
MNPVVIHTKYKKTALSGSIPLKRLARERQISAITTMATDPRTSTPSMGINETFMDDPL